MVSLGRATQAASSEGGGAGGRTAGWRAAVRLAEHPGLSQRRKSLGEDGHEPRANWRKKTEWARPARGGEVTEEARGRRGLRRRRRDEAGLPPVELAGCDAPGSCETDARDERRVEPLVNGRGGLEASAKGSSGGTGCC